MKFDPKNFALLLHPQAFCSLMIIIGLSIMAFSDVVNDEIAPLKGWTPVIIGCFLIAAGLAYLVRAIVLERRRKR